ncbi:MAG: hypothetical protein JNM24_17480 [Bdellovibrionaceae bacterium]|nr:hypothetical protein [Pseudobdellovibrionaceae bacterium]
MMKLFVLVFGLIFLSGCDDFKFGYRNCNKETNECLPVNIKFKDKKDCMKYLEHGKMSCMGGKYLDDAPLNSAVCHRSNPSVGYGECVDL